MKNPFIFGKIVEKSDYCRRDSVEKKIAVNIESGQNLAFLGPRRSGKTSTVLYVLSKMNKIPFVEVDFNGVRDEVDIASRIINAVGTMQGRFYKLESALKFLGRFRPTIITEPDGSGFQITTSIAKDQIEESIDTAFSLINKFTQKKQLAVFFDEFQMLKQLEHTDSLIAYLRTKIQKFHRTSFVFAGSVRHLIDEIFRSPKSPFFKSAEILELEPIDQDAFFSFIAHKMAFKKINVPNEQFMKI